MQISRYSAAAFQLWEAWPLVAWPAVAVVVTVLLDMVPGGTSRVIGIIWTIACVLLSAFALTYLLPADDNRVAGLHGLGVVRLPQSAGMIFDMSGRTVVTRDLDPLIYVNSGYDGYVATLFAGDYTVDEHCFNAAGTTQTAPLQRVGIHVVLGGVTIVPNLCPSG
jgi:hypothetical protein